MAQGGPHSCGRRDLGNRGDVMRPTCMMPACVSSEPSSFARSTGIWPGVRRAGLPKAEPAADVGLAELLSGAALI
jgi:hypothetical protein